MEISGAAALALESLSSAEVKFLQSLPKAELHAHLNGSIPISTVKDLASEYLTSSAIDVSNNKSTIIKRGIEVLSSGLSVIKLTDVFTVFPAVHALTSTPAALGRATRSVLSAFLEAGGGGAPAQCHYLELRTTPRETEAMDRERYLRVVLSEMQRYRADQVALIVSLDRRMNKDVVGDCVRIASKLKSEGERVVAVDLCGNPEAGDMEDFAPFLVEAKEAGLGLTLHIAETEKNTPEETLLLLSCNPDRLGHATFLNDEAISIVLDKKICVELSLSSNLISKCVPTLESHHIQKYLKEDHPITICTDDILPFKTSLLAEYALLLAQRPYGLGLDKDQVKRLAEMSMEARFRQ